MSSWQILTTQSLPQAVLVSPHWLLILRRIKSNAGTKSAWWVYRSRSVCTEKVQFRLSRPSLSVSSALQSSIVPLQQVSCSGKRPRLDWGLRRAGPEDGEEDKDVLQSGPHLLTPAGGSSLAPGQSLLTDPVAVVLELLPTRGTLWTSQHKKSFSWE